MRRASCAERDIVSRKILTQSSRKVIAAVRHASLALAQHLHHPHTWSGLAERSFGALRRAAKQWDAIQSACIVTYPRERLLQLHWLASAKIPPSILLDAALAQ